MVSSVTPGLWDFAAAAAWERQVEAEQWEDGTDDDSSGTLSPTAGLSPAELWMRSLDDPGVTRRLQREREELALSKLTPLEQIKQRMLADAALKEKLAREESARLAAEAQKETFKLAATAEDDKTASRHDLRRLHNVEQAKQRDDTQRDDTATGLDARERFFRSLSRPKGRQRLSTVRRTHRRERSSSGSRFSDSAPADEPSSSSSEDNDSEFEPDGGSTIDDTSLDDCGTEVIGAEIARTSGRRRTRKYRTRRRPGSGAQSVIREHLRGVAAKAALPTPEESEQATEAKAQLMSQSDGDMHASAATPSSTQVLNEAAEGVAGLRWGTDSEDEDNQFGGQYVTLGAPGGWNQSEIAIEWGTLSGARQDSNSSSKVDAGSSGHRGKPVPAERWSRPRSAGSCVASSGLSEFGAHLAQRSAANMGAAVNEQRSVGKASNRPHTSKGRRVDALAAPIIRHSYDERVQAEDYRRNTKEEDEDDSAQDHLRGSIIASRHTSTGGSSASVSRLAEKDASTTAIHARLASVPIRQELPSAAATADDDNLPLVKRELAPDFAQRSAGHSNGSSCNSDWAMSVAGNLEQATRAQKFFRSHKRFGLQPAGFRPDGSKAATVSTVNGHDSCSTISAPPPSSAAAAMTNRWSTSSSSSSVIGGSMQGSTMLLTTSAAARADRNKSKWERYQRYGNVGSGPTGGSNNSSSSSVAGRKSQRHVAVPMAVAGASKTHRATSATYSSRPRGTTAVAAAACRVQRNRAVTPHVQGPNSVATASGLGGR